MSAGLQGFVQGISNAASQAADRKYQEAQDKKKSQWTMYSKVAYDNRPLSEGGPTPEERAEAMDMLGKLGGKDVKAGNQKLSSFRSMLDAITGKGGQQPQGQPQGQAGAQPQQSAQPQARGPLPAPQVPQAQPQGGGMTENMPNGQPAPGTAGSKPMQRGGPLAAPQMPPVPTEGDIEGAKDRAASAETKRKLDSETTEQAFWEERAKKVLGDKANPRDIALYAGTKGAHLPPQEKRIADKGVARPGEDPSTGKPFEGIWDHIVEPDGSETWAKRPDKGNQGIPRQGDDVLGDKILATMKEGIEVLGPDGKPMTEERIKEMGPTFRWWNVGGKFQVLPVSVKDTKTTVNNQVVASSPFEIQKIPQGAGTVIGQARTGSSNTPTNIVLDNTGTPHVVGSTSQPNTPPLTGRGAAPSQQPQGSAPATQPAAPVQQKPRGPLAPPTEGQSPAPAAPAQSAGGGGRQVSGVTPGMDKEFRQTARTIVQAMTQTLGSKENPGLKTLITEAPKVLEDPKKVARVGTAIKMMLGDPGDYQGAHVGAGVSVGPVSASLGGFGEFMSQYLNMPKKTIDKINENMNAAMKDMTKEERSLVTSSISAFEESIAMRAINKSGVSNSQIAAIQKVLPLVGVNAFTKDDFADRVTNWVQQGMNGSWGVPPQYFPPEFLQRLKEVPDEMNKLRAGGGQSKRGPLDAPGKPKTIRMKSPDGIEKDVPEDQVEKFKKLGATVVKKAA